ncbi:LytTR family DNA-binding domain-containing protein [Hephaestia caeni]|uniref:LytTR family DNA-binding domain-containing protein n=1 Tax=Hephaestia caeni TaxID=645617 RepID=UPI001475B16E|nr:LytTR family DNA-binding domain-containing protein [Hephaestia caeni]
MNRALVRLPGLGPLAAASAAAIVIMTVVGGFGTGALPIAARAGLWALLIGWNAAKWQLWFAMLVRKRADWPRAAAIGAIVINLPLPAEIALALSLFGAAGPVPSVEIWVEALAISAALFALVMLARRSAAPVAAPSMALRPDGLLDRAGLASPADLLAVEAEDHYCRIHAVGRVAVLVHGRFGDALDEVRALDGLRVHRGAWVAAGAIAGAAREGRRWRLDLTGRHRIVVSARYLPAVRDRGWLRRR